MDENGMHGGGDEIEVNRLRRVQPTRPPDQSGDELAQLADALLHQANAVREHYEELGSLLDEAALTDDPPAQPTGEPSSEESVNPLRLIAKDMAFSGVSREETEGYLRTSFGIDESDAIVEEVFEEIQPERPRRRRFARFRR